MTISPRNREFIAAFQSGSYESISQLCHLHYAPLLDFAQQITGEAWPANAIVLETFVKLVHMRTAYDNEANIKAFLYITVRNRCMAYMQAGHEPDERAFAMGTQEQGMEQLHAAVATMPEKCRKVFEYYYGKRLPVKEIAEQLDLDMPTVAALREKALKLLCEKQVYAAPLMIYFLSMAMAAS